MLRKTWFFWGLLAGIALGSPSARAQYASDFQTNLISAVGSNWSGSYIVGSNNVADVLWISGNGSLSDASSYLGYELSGSNNIALLTGTQSVWRTSSQLYVGYAGAGNQLIITNLSYGDGVSDGGVYSAGGFVGYMPSSSNNLVLIAGTGTYWANGFNHDLYIGYAGAGNQLVLSNVSQGFERLYPNAGAVYDQNANVGFMSTSSNNMVLVSGTDTTWENHFDLTIGASGSGNQLIITNGGVVENRFGYLGFNSTGRSNAVWVAGSGSVWFNSSDLIVGRSGRNNRMSIAGGGMVTNNFGYLGYNTSSSNNSVLVAGTNSIWKNAAALSIGTNGMGNSLVISGGGQVWDVTGYVGGNATSGGNSALVTDTNSIWNNGTFLFIGYSGSGNSMVISNGGCVRALFSSTFTTDPPDSCLGYNMSSSNNNVLVTGAGSVWSNGSGLCVGYLGAGNRLVVADGGRIAVASSGFLGTLAIVGYDASSSNNTLLVTGAGSACDNVDLIVGAGSSGNSAVISNGGQVTGPGFGIGSNFGVGSNSGKGTGSSNTILVASGGLCQGDISIVGITGSSNSLVVAGGSVVATNLIVGYSLATGCDNMVRLDSGKVTITNSAHTGTLEVGRGEFILNGGVLQVDRLVMTNGCGLFVRTGGTLIVGTLVLDPNLSAVGDGVANGWKQQYGLDPLDSTLAAMDSDGDGFSNLQEYLAGTDPTNSASSLRIISIAPQGNSLLVTWTMGTGKTNALQATGGGVGGAYGTNGFADIFVVTNTAGTITNYLEAGAVTNMPARYYRVRLVP